MEIRVLKLTQVRHEEGQWVREQVSGPPVASPDTASAVAGGVAITMSPLNNDTDPLGNGLTITAASVTVGGGSVEIVNSGKNLRYTPPGSAGSATISYTAEDSSGVETSSTVAVTIFSAGAGNVTISAQTTSGLFAPAPIWFKAVATGFDVDRPDHNLDFIWDFGDEGATFANLSGRLTAIPVFNDRNVAFGPWVSHVYREPGVYTVTCEVRRHGADNSPVVRQMQVSVDDPDDVFGDARTIYASTDGDFTGVPVGVPAGNKVTTTSYQEVWSKMGSPRRLLFKGENEFTYDGGTKGNVGKTFIGSWGTGRAVLNCTGSQRLSFKDAFSQLVIQNIITQGTYDMATQVGDGNGPSINENAVGTITYDNIRSANMLSHYSTSDAMNQRPGSAIAYLDCEAEDWLHYGFASNGYYLGAFHGVWVHAPLDAAKWAGGARDPNPAGPVSNGGAAYRVQTPSAPDAGAADGGFGSFTHFCSCDGYSSFAGKFNGDQPVYKLGGRAEHGARFNIDRMISEGSSDTNFGTGSEVADIQDVIYDRYIKIGTANCGLPLGIQCAGTTVRNSYTIIPHNEFEKKEFKAGINEYAIGLNSEGSPQENKDGPMEIYGNTAVNWKTREQAERTDSTPYYMAEIGPSSWPNKIDSNNIVHSPFWGQTAAVDTSVQLVGMEGIYPGRKPSPELPLEPEYATPETFTYGGYVDQPTVAAIIPTGANLTAETGPNKKIPARYIDGTLRGATPARGAFAPD